MESEKGSVKFTGTETYRKGLSRVVFVGRDKGVTGGKKEGK